MFDAFKIIGHAFSGRFRENEELSKGFWVWVGGQVFSIAALAYSSTMSYAFYLQLIDQAPSAPQIAGMVTILVAVLAFLLINYVTFRSTFIWNGGKMSSHAIMGLILGVLLAVGVVAWDVNANLTGVAPISIQTTAEVMSKDTDGITSRYQSLINEERQAIAQIHKAYTYRDGSVHFQPRPVTSNSQSKWQADAEKVARHEATIAKYQELMTKETDQELTAYSRDLERHDSQIIDKTGIHTGIVKWVYGLVLLVSLWCSNYSNLALDYVNANPLGDIPGTQEDKFGPNKWSNPIQTRYQQPVDTGKIDDIEAQLAAITAEFNAGKNAAPQPADTGKIDELEAQLAAITAELNAGKNADREPVGYPRKKPVQEPENTGNSGKNRPNHTEITGKAVPPASGNSRTVVERFYQSPPPDNTGKTYDLSKTEQRKVAQVKASYKAHLADHGTPPTQATLAQELGWSEKTARKYFHLSGLRKQEQDE